MKANGGARRSPRPDGRISSSCWELMTPEARASLVDGLREFSEAAADLHEVAAGQG